MKSQGNRGTVLSLIVPTYNERENLVPLFESIQRALSDLSNLVYELIVVDDNSPDGTADLAESLAQIYPVKVIRRINERGLATAVVEGFKQAVGDVLGVIDADLQHPPDIIPNLLREIWDGADVAVATRYIEGGGTKGWSLGRKIISKGATLLSHLLLPMTRRVKDPMSGFFLVKREVVEGAKLMPIGYKILLEVLARGRADSVVAVPYVFTERVAGETKFNLREQLNYLKHLYHLSQVDREIKRFFKFCLVGASGVSINMGLLWLITDVAGFYYLISAIFAIEAAIISNFTLNELWTFRDRRGGSAWSVLERAVKFNAVSAVGAGINLMILYGLTESLGLYYLASNLVAIAVVTMWNFGLSYLWTWRRKSPSPNKLRV